MTQIVLNIEDASLVPSLKQILGAIKGVTIGKLVKEKVDPTLMTEEEFFAKIDRAEKQPGKSFANVDEIDKFIRSL